MGLVIKLYVKISNKIKSINQILRQKELRRLYICSGEYTVSIRETGNIINSPEHRDNIVLGKNVVVDGILQSAWGKGKLSIGDMSYIGTNTRIWAFDNIKIGKNVLISHNCSIVDSDCHPIDPIERKLDYERILFNKEGIGRNVINKPIVIEDNVWIGANAIILKGITIGERAVVSAGAVVTKSVPANVIVAGNPAKVIREIGKK